MKKLLGFLVVFVSALCLATSALAELSSMSPVKVTGKSSETNVFQILDTGEDALVTFPEDGGVYLGETPASSVSEGTIYYDTSANVLKYEDNAGTKTIANTSGGAGDNTLDDSYDQGGAGSGKKIEADSGAVELEVDDTSNNGALLLDMDDSTNNPNVLTITNAGSGNDITAPSFSLTAGALVAQTSLTSPSLTAYDATANGALNIDGKGSGKVIIANTSTGVIEVKEDIYLENDEYISNSTNGQVDIKTANLNLDSGKQYMIDGSQIDSDDLSDVSSIAMLDEAETITGNFVNTSNPWADNEVVDALTVDGGTIDNSVIGGSTAAAITGTTIDASTKFTGSELENTDSITLDVSNAATKYVDISNSGAGAAQIYVDGAQIDSDDLSDTSSIAMLDEAESITGNWVNTSNPWVDNEVSDTLTASKLTGTGSTSDAVDLATSEVNGNLANSNIANSSHYVVVTLTTDGQYSASLDPLRAFQMPWAATLTEVSVHARDIDTGDADETYSIDIEEAGTTVLSSAISISADDTAYVGTVSDSAIADNAKIDAVLSCGGTSPAIDDITILLTFKVANTS